MTPMTRARQKRHLGYALFILAALAALCTAYWSAL